MNEDHTEQAETVATSPSNIAHLRRDVRRNVACPTIPLLLSGLEAITAGSFATPGVIGVFVGPAWSVVGVAGEEDASCVASWIAIGIEAW
jgi:hypothetical protein